MAALAGLEKAEETGDAAGAALSVQRILMGHALIAAWGGIPLIYMGDELALGNDHGYRDVPEHAHDSRWIHRPRMDWTAAEARRDGTSHASRVWLGIQHILARRRATAALHAAHPIRVARCENTQVFAFRRDAPTGTLLCLFNFAEGWAHLSQDWARAQGVTRFWDELSDQPVETHHGNIVLPPYARVWLA